MFKYVSDVSLLSHNIIKEFITTKDIAVDATLGNGYDCDFLSNNFKKVYAFEIQKEACEKYIDKNNNVIIINESHHKIDKFINEEIDCICFISKFNRISFRYHSRLYIFTKSNI